jgi:DNA-binding protein H-NS
MPAVTLGTDSQTHETLKIGDIERRSGLYVLGKPGMGKSALLVNMMKADIDNRHGVFFLDPHGEAITDLLERLDTSGLSRTLLLDPEDEKHSFGINLLSCKNIRSLKERTETYTRAYNVFYKLWEDQFGPWLQLILQNTLWAFIENPEYTLAEVPMFLNPYNEVFRNHILRNVKHNPAVVDFWQYEFFQRREREQQERVDAALTRITTLLTHPYVRHIIGQRQTTIDFERILQQPVALLIRLSANLASDIKKFIGTILISELLFAVRNRPEYEREQFCIYVDEFQNYASSEDFTLLITEARKFGIAATVCHQERFGQFAENQKLLGATSAAVNKVFFQLTVKDAEELAPEFAEKVELTEIRREAELVISPRPVDEVWTRGHPPLEVMYIRGKYFWIVELLRNSSTEKYVPFDPLQVSPEYWRKNPPTFQLNEFDDWAWYQSTPDMLRRGISLLNQYYYDWMNMQYDPDEPLTNTQVELIINVIACWGGVLGVLPMLRPVLPAAKRSRLVYLMNEKLKQNAEQERQERRDRIQALKDEIQYLKDHGVKEERWGSVSSGGSSGFSGDNYSRDPFRRGTVSSSHSSSQSTPVLRYVRGTKEDFEKQEKHLESLHRQILTLERSQPLRHSAYMGMLTPDLSPPAIHQIQELAIQAGMPMHEVEQLIEWEVEPLTSAEKDVLSAMITKDEGGVAADDTALRERPVTNDPTEEQEYDASLGRQLLGMLCGPCGEFVSRGDMRLHPALCRGFSTKALIKRLCPPALSSEKAAKRLTWQLAELQRFIYACFYVAPRILAEEPIKEPSRKYEETLRVERTQQDLVNEMALKLSRLPRFTAYAKVIEERNGEQLVHTQEIQTLKPPPVQQSIATIEPRLLAASHKLCKERDAIEDEIRQRQDRWRNRRPPPTAAAAIRRTTDGDHTVKAKSIDWAEYSDDDLERFVVELEAELRKRLAEKRQALKQRIEGMVQEEGMSVGELFPQAARRKGRPKGKRAGTVKAVKYRNPDNPEQTWTGIGRKPAWMVAALSSGKTLGDFVI